MFLKNLREITWKPTRAKVIGEWLHFIKFFSFLKIDLSRQGLYFFLAPDLEFYSFLSYISLYILNLFP